MKLTILTAILTLAAINGDAQTTARKINEMVPRAAKSLQPGGDAIVDPPEKEQAKSAGVSDVMMLPMIWFGRSGGEDATTAILVRNFSTRLADIQIEFLDEFGRRVDVPIMDPSGQYSILRGTLGAGEIVAIVTDYENTRLQHLHARLIASPAGSVEVSGFIGMDRSGSGSVIGLAAAASAYTSLASSSVISSRDNMRLMISNGNGLSSSVTVTASYPDGRYACRTTVSVPALGLRDFSVRDELTCLRFYEGVAGISVASSRGISPTLYHEAGDMVGNQVFNLRGY